MKKKTKKKTAKSSWFIKGFPKDFSVSKTKGKTMRQKIGSFLRL